MDVFLSHAWVDQLAVDQGDVNPRRGMVSRLRDGLERAGLEVFYDQQEIVAFDHIEQRIRDGLRSSTLFVCWYSKTYRSRRACVWELTAALTTDPRRIALVNPEPGIDHILPTSLLGGLAASVPDADDAAGWQALVDRVVERAAALGGTFGPIASAESRTWYGDPPVRFSRFVGRSEPLWQLDSLLRPPPPATGGRAAPQAVVVHGLGGVGKTALACEYATRFAGAYPAGVVWLRAGGWPEGLDPGVQLNLAMQAGYAAIARQVEPRAASEDQAQEHPESTAEQVLERHFSDRGSYLWVVDDLPEGLSASDFALCLPPTAQGTALVTTRGTTYRHVPNLELLVLPPDEGLEMLLHDAPGLAPSELASARALAFRLGYLPIALEVVGSLTSLPGVGPSALLAELSTDATGYGLVEEAADNPMISASATEHTPSVTMTFGPSIRRLDAASFALLAAASVINVAPLPLRVLRPVASSVAGLDARDLRTAVGTLLSRSLARAVDQDTLEIHGLVSGAVLAHVEDSDALRVAATQAAGTVVVRELGDVEELKTHPQNRRIADFGLSLALTQDDGTLDADGLRILGRFLHVEMRFDEAVEVERRAVLRAKAEAGPTSRDALVAEVNLAISLAQRSPEEARVMLTACAQALEQQFGPTDIDAMTANHNLANQIGAVDPQRARDLALRTYDARRATLGLDHPHTLFSLHSLLAQDVVPEPYANAVEAYEDLVRRRTRLLGEDGAATLTSLSNFVERLVRVGKPALALPLARGLVERRAALYGPDHAATTTAYVRLLCVLLSVGDSSSPEFEGLIGLIKGHAERMSNASLTALSNAGDQLRIRGDHADALRVLQIARVCAAKRLAASDQLRLLIEHNLAATVGASGDLSRAVSIYDGLLPVLTEALGAEHRLTLRAQRQRALLLARSGDIGSALPIQLDLASTWSRMRGPNSPELAEALGDVGDTYALQGRPGEADRYRRLQHETGAAQDIGLARRI